MAKNKTNAEKATDLFKVAMLMEQGFTVREIGTRLGMSKSYVWNITKEVREMVKEGLIEVYETTQPEIISRILRLGDNCMETALRIMDDNKNEDDDDLTPDKIIKEGGVRRRKPSNREALPFIAEARYCYESIIKITTGKGYSGQKNSDIVNSKFVAAQVSDEQGLPDLTFTELIEKMCGVDKAAVEEARRRTQELCEEHKENNSDRIDLPNNPEDRLTVELQNL